jgi:transcriptional regulator with XRE-family HTH domain
MRFSAQLLRLRKQRGWSPQNLLVDALGLHLTQIKRYEAGAFAPSLDALKKIALIPSLSLDELVFTNAEHGPDEALKLKFEAIRQFDCNGRKIAEGVLNPQIVQHLVTPVCAARRG